MLSDGVSFILFKALNKATLKTNQIYSKSVVKLTNVKKITAFFTR